MSELFKYGDSLYRKDKNGKTEWVDTNDVKNIQMLGSKGRSACIMVRRVFDSKVFVRKTSKDKTRLIREHNILLNIHRRRDHPRIITTVPWKPDFVSRKDFLLEYCEGGDLHSLIHPNLHIPHSNTRFPKKFIWRVMLDLAEALAFIHYGSKPSGIDLGWTAVIHRNVKLANILFRNPYLPNSNTSFPYPILANFWHATADHESKGVNHP